MFIVPESFFNASLDKASDDNERNALAIELADGRKVAFVQIAGLIARRIVCFVQPGAHLRRGERFGLIRFGSRLDVYLPPGTEPLVTIGQTTVAGETVLADGDGHQPKRCWPGGINVHDRQTSGSRHCTDPAALAERNDVGGDLRRRDRDANGADGPFRSCGRVPDSAAAILDGLDGRLARALRSESLLGAELDSLADIVNFGVAPAIILYFWTLGDASVLGWASALVYIICCALRLGAFQRQCKVWTW